MSNCKYIHQFHLALVFSLSMSPLGVAAQEMEGDGSLEEGAPTPSAMESPPDGPAEAEDSPARPSDGAASSEVDPGVPEAEDAGEEMPGHKGQFGARLGVAVPYVFAVKYGEGARCDDAGEEFCRRFGAAMLDLEIGFGVSPQVEISLLGRFGLAQDEAADAAPLAFGLGVRGYTSAESPLKLFFGGRAMLDVTPLEDSTNPEWKSVDIGLRGEFGFQVDITRYAGVYLQLGETLSFLRGLYFVTDGSIGVQVRLP